MHSVRGASSALIAASLALAAACSTPALREGDAGPASGVQGTLREDVSWRGTVVIAGDLLVPRGRTLRIQAGTRVRVRPADSTKTEPEYLDNATELLVRGRLLVEGRPDRPVLFEALRADDEASEARWGGIVFDGGEGEIRGTRLAGAETGLTLLESSPHVSGLSVSDVRQGIAVGRGSSPRLSAVDVDARELGVACWSGSSPTLESVDARAGEHEGLLVAPGARPRVVKASFRGGTADVLWGAAQEPPASLAGGRTRRVPGAAAEPGSRPSAARPRPEWQLRPPFEPRVRGPLGGAARVYRGEQTIGESTRWEGDVLVDGTVLVAPDADLTIAPGTVVRFAFRDSDGDGVGESEIFLQGRILAEGTPEQPIVFTALEGRGPGRWGAINLMGSDAGESRLAYVLVESSFRGLHGHFSRFRVEHSVFRGNYRSLQFQESTAALLDCAVTGSVSAARFRDSTVGIEGLTVADNRLGVQILRSTFSLSGSSIVGNALAGLHARESEGTIAGNRLEGNWPGLRASDCRLVVEGNVIVANAGAGLQLRRCEGRIVGNRVAANVGNGVSTDSPRMTLRGNAIAGNLRFELESSTAEAIDAAQNWWGRGGPMPESVFDVRDDPRLGPVLTEPPLPEPPETP